MADRCSLLRHGFGVPNPGPAVPRIESCQPAARPRVMACRNANGPGSLPPGPLRSSGLGLFRRVGAVRARPVDQLDVGHRRIVAGAHAALEDAQVAALALTIAGPELDEQLADRNLVAQARERETAI